jgi:hypothetical protein
MNDYTYRTRWQMFLEFGMTAIVGMILFLHTLPNIQF